MAEPLCASCRQRHPLGQSMAYYDERDDLYRCPKCEHPIDVDGECGTPKCCGNVWPRAARTGGSDA